MAKRDFYDVLGVSKSATAEEIRRAHRKKARELHPDINKAPDAQAQFAELQEAYEALSDETRRAHYDRFGHADPRAAGMGGRDGGSVRWSTQGGGSSGTEFEMDDLSSVFDAFFGNRYGSSASGQPQSARSNRGRRAQRQHSIEVRVPFLLAAKGGSHSIRVAVEGEQKTIEVSIPPATADGAKLRVTPAGVNSPIVLVIKVDAHPVLSRSDQNPGTLDLSVEVPLTVSEALLGATIQVPTLDGSASLAIPPGTGSGKKLRLRGMGIRAADGRTGDLYAVTRLVVPDPSLITPDVRSALESLSKRERSPRNGPGWPD